jgi:hypothetical protein
MRNFLSLLVILALLAISVAATHNSNDVEIDIHVHVNGKHMDIPAVIELPGVPTPDLDQYLADKEAEEKAKETTTDSSAAAAAEVNEVSIDDSAAGELDEAAAVSQEDATVIAKYSKKFGKKWAAVERKKRAAAIKSNLQRVKEHNKNPSRGHDASLNQFSDLEREEFLQKIATFKAPTNPSSGASLNEAGEEDSEDAGEFTTVDHSFDAEEEGDDGNDNYPARCDVDPLTGKAVNATCHDEFVASQEESAAAEFDAVATSVNWVTAKKVIAVRDQKQCGSW